LQESTSGLGCGSSCDLTERQELNACIRQPVQARLLTDYPRIMLGRMRGKDDDMFQILPLTWRFDAGPPPIAQLKPSCYCAAKLPARLIL
jgi:hypothetical protein